MVKRKRTKTSKEYSSILNSKISTSLLMATVCGFLLLISFVIYFKYATFYAMYNPPVDTQSMIPLNVYTTEGGPVTSTPTPILTKEFRSERLGITFTYLSKIDNGGSLPSIQNYYTKEIGNVAYLYWPVDTNTIFTGTDRDFLSTIASHAYSIERFWKNSSLSLQEAIQQQILQGYSQDDCYVLTSMSVAPSRDEQSYINATIQAKIPPNATYQERMEQIAKCPKKYIPDGTDYFVMDPKHANRFYFVTVGQSNTPSGLYGHGTWDDTLHIF